MRYRKIIVALGIGILTSVQSFAGDYYWVGGNGNWNQATTHWATSSGGAAFHTVVPTAADDVFFDDNSGLAAGTVTLNVAGNCRNMTWNVTGTPTFAKESQNLNISGLLTLQPGMTFTCKGGAITFTRSDNYSFPLTLNGLSGTTTINFNGSGNYTLTSLVLSGAGAFTFSGTGSCALPENIDLACSGTVTFNGNYASSAPLKQIKNTLAGAVTFGATSSFTLSDELDLDCSGTVTFGGNYTSLPLKKITKPGTNAVIFNASGGYTLSDVLELSFAAAVTFNGNFTSSAPLKKLTKTTGNVTFNATGTGPTLSDELELACGGAVTFQGNYTSLPLKKITSTNAVNFNASGSYVLSDELELSFAAAVTFNGNFTSSAPLKKLTKTTGNVTFNATGTGPTLSDELELACGGTVTFQGNYTSLPFKKITSSNSFAFNTPGSYMLSDELEINYSGNFTFAGNFTSSAPLKKLTKEAGTVTFNATGTSYYTLSDELALDCGGAVTFQGIFGTPVPLKTVTNIKTGSVTFNATGTGYTLSDELELDCAGGVTFTGVYTTSAPLKKATNIKAGGITFNASGTGYTLSDELALDCAGGVIFNGVYTTPVPLKKLTNIKAGGITFNAAGTGYTLSDELELECAGVVAFNGVYTTPVPLKKLTNIKAGGITFNAAGTGFTLSDEVILDCAGTAIFGGKDNMLAGLEKLTNAKNGAVAFNIDITGNNNYTVGNLDLKNAGSTSFNISYTGSGSYAVTVDGSSVTNTGAVAFGGGTATNKADIRVSGAVKCTGITFKGYHNYDLTDYSFEQNGALTISEYCSAMINGPLINKSGVTFSTSGNCNVAGLATITGGFTFSGTGNYIFTDSLKVSGNISFTDGNLDVSGQYVSAADFSSVAGNATRQLNISGSTIDVNNWTYSGGAPLPADKALGSLIRVKTNFTGKNGDFYDTVETGSGTLAYGSFSTIIMNKGGQLNAVAGTAITTGTLRLNAIANYTIFAGSTVNVIDLLEETATDMMSLRSTGTAQAIINMGDPSVVAMNGVGLYYIKITGPGVNYPVNGYNAGGNAGWLITNTVNPTTSRDYYWRGATDASLTNISNWDLGFPGSGVQPTAIFGSNDDIYFPTNPNQNNITLTSSGCTFRNLYFNADQNLTINIPAKVAHSGKKIYVNRGTLNIVTPNRENSVTDITISDSLIIQTGATFTLNQVACSFGSTLVNGTFTNIKSYDHTLVWKDIEVNGTFASTNSGWNMVARVTGDVVVNPGGVLLVQPTYFGNQSWTFGGSLIINGNGKATFINMMPSPANSSYACYFNGSIIDPNGRLTIDKANGVYFQAPGTYTLDLHFPDIPGITNSGLYFNLKQGFTMTTPINTPTNNVYIHTASGPFNTNGNNIRCNIFGVTGNNSVANTVLNLNNSRLYIQQYDDRASNYNQQSVTAALVFNSSNKHFFNFEGTKTFQSIAFTNSAPLAQFNSVTASPVLNVDTLIIDTKKIEFDNWNHTNTYNWNINTNITVKVNRLLDVLQSFDMYPTNQIRNNYIYRTTTFSVKEILEHGDVCNTKSNIYSTGSNTFAFVATAAVNPQNIAFAGMNFTGTGLLTAPASNNLGGNSGNVAWSASSAGQTYYWIGDTGNWSDPAHWSFTSGGTVPTGCIPSASDNVIFDCGSFSAADQVVTIDLASATVHHITWDAALAGCSRKGKLAGNPIIITGSADFRGCAAAPVEISFTSLDADEITTGDLLFTQNINFAHSGSYTLKDNLLSTMDIFHKSGGIVAQNDSVSCRVFRSVSQSADPALARWFDFTNTKLTVKHTANADNVLYLHLDNVDLSRCTFTGSHFYTQNGGVFRIAGTNVSKTLPLYDLSATGNIIIDQALFNVSFRNVDVRPNDVSEKKIYPFTCRNLFLKAGKIYGIANSGTLTINKQLTTDASGCSPETVIMGRNTAFNTYTVTNLNLTAESSTIFKAKVGYIKVTSATYPLNVNAGTDAGGNINVNFSNQDIPTINFFWVGRSGNWDDPGHWSIGESGGNPAVTNPDLCIPTINDNVFFDDKSFTAANQQVTLNLAGAHNCKNMEWSAGAGAMAPILYIPTTMNGESLNIYGSLDLAAGVMIRSAYTYGLIINMMGTSQDENAQYLKFNGFGKNSADNDRKCRFVLKGGGRYDLLDDMYIFTHSTAAFTISANSTFYSRGNKMQMGGSFVINGGSKVPNTIDISGSEIKIEISYYYSTPQN